MQSGPVTRMNRTKNAFHSCYMELCRKKNINPLQQITKGNKVILDLIGDRIKRDEWTPINKALMLDKTLTSITIKLRKNKKNVLTNQDIKTLIDNGQHYPSIIVKSIFTELISSIENCLKNNNVITAMCIEGLPMNTISAQAIAKGLTMNASLQQISLARTSLMDEGCEIICLAIKCLPNIESINFAHCHLGFRGAEAITDMIKYQKIIRFSEGWKKSLRYQTVDPESFGGLRRLILNHNPDIGSQGFQLIIDVLNDDAWIKDVEVRNCGITDEACTAIIQCLDMNKTLQIFDINENNIDYESFSCHLKRELGPTSGIVAELETNLTATVDISKMRETIQFLEQQLTVEINHRKHLNEQLHSQMMEYQKELTSVRNTVTIPDGYTMIRNETLQQLLNDRNGATTGGQTELNREDSPQQIGKKHTKRLIKKAKSETLPKEIKETMTKYSKSEVGIVSHLDQQRNNTDRMYFEHNVGDTTQNYPNSHQITNIKGLPSIPKANTSNDRVAVKSVSIHRRKDTERQSSSIDITTDFARSLFMNKNSGGNREKHNNSMCSDIEDECDCEDDEDTNDDTN